MKLWLIEEIARNQWAMTVPAFRSIMAVVEGSQLDDRQAAYLHSLTVDEKTEAVANFGERLENGHYASVLNNVGFLPVYGPTTPRAGLFQRASGVASYDALMDDYKALEADRRVDTIATMFDTPGGAVTGNSDWADTIKSSSKKTVAYAWMATSAGYWAASAASKIYAPETGMVGSIGTVMTIVDKAKADEKRGIQRFEIVSTQSPHKRAGADSPEHQALVDGLADVFIKNVAVNRGVSEEYVLNNYGQGATVLAKRALEAGMIDGIMGVNDFVNMLVDNKNTSTFFVPSAQADSTAEGNDMAENTVSNDAPLTAEKLRELYPSAVKEIQTEAIAAEHARLQSLEKMASAYSGQAPVIRDAVRGLIDSRKYDANSNVGTLGADVFEAATNAQKQQLTAFGSAHTEGTEAAKVVGQATPNPLDNNNEEAKHKAGVAALAAAMKEVN